MNQSMDNLQRLPAEFRVDLGAGHGDQHLSVWQGQASLPMFMDRNRNACYTTIVSIGCGTRVALLDFHCSRLLEGFAALASDSNVPTQQKLASALKLLMAKARDSSGITDSAELQFVVVLISERGATHLRVFASILPADVMARLRRPSPVIIECRGAPRRHPRVKNTEWYHTRAPLENMRSEPARETVLLGTNRSGFRVLLEGLVTNFFVVTKRQEVWTAPDDVVLPGSMRHLVAQACRKLGVPFHQESMPLANWKEFDAAFLTNARQWLQPVSRMLVPEHQVYPEGNEVPREFALPEISDGLALVHTLRTEVMKLAENLAESFDSCG